MALEDSSETFPPPSNDFASHDTSVHDSTTPSLRSTSPETSGIILLVGFWFKSGSKVILQTFTHSVNEDEELCAGPVTPHKVLQYLMGPLTNKRLMYTIRLLERLADSEDICFGWSTHGYDAEDVECWDDQHFRDAGNLSEVRDNVAQASTPITPLSPIEESILRPDGQGPGTAYAVYAYELPLVNLTMSQRNSNSYKQSKVAFEKDELALKKHESKIRKCLTPSANRPLYTIPFRPSPSHQDDAESIFSNTASSHADSSRDPPSLGRSVVIRPDVKRVLQEVFRPYKQDVLSRTASRSLDGAYRTFRASRAAIQVANSLNIDLRGKKALEGSYQGVTIHANEILEYAIPQHSPTTQRNFVMDVRNAQSVLQQLQPLKGDELQKILRINNRARQLQWTLGDVRSFLKLWLDDRTLDAYETLTDPDDTTYCSLSSSAFRSVLKECTVSGLHYLIESVTDIPYRKQCNQVLMLMNEAVVRCQCVALHISLKNLSRLILIEQHPMSLPLVLIDFLRFAKVLQHKIFIKMQA
jgi:hypothetical protein